ncbi:hypothetical protein DACRYDRAFT_20334 [Dacryopinax primogenitus]|uniref:Cytoplasmic tRNA 2-thiolation protein 2 n=1 Tax=Dacryopinax primogenitus (strain DJM 731) TaxID=1858805 RepID=M5G7H2_DACPD|nr:uncharacterized protein DACRYDRAFT_20334 [Dacryopinax primogenitus]EJU04679.1 hypothetical protein DACRYDRAFT_20334 [Dacryopinax primogenitus]
MSCEGPPSAEDLMPKRPRYDRDQTCIKCKSHRGNLVIKHAVYCFSCLPAMLIRKFRRALSASLDPAAPPRGTPSRTPPPDVVLALSGGPSSTVLLDMVWKCFSVEGSGRKDERRQVGSVRAVYVDWSCLGGKSVVESLREACQRYGIELTMVMGEAAFDAAWTSAVGMPRPTSELLVNQHSDRLPFLPSPMGAGPSDPIATLRAHLASLPTPSAIPAMLRTLTRLLILNTTCALSCSVLMLGTCLPRLSVDLLENVAYGGGFSLGSEREESVSLPLGEVHVIRPLRDWSLKELGWWLHSRSLPVPRGVDGKPDRLLAPSGGKTLSKLTEDFVLGLERDYPSTVSTISKTATKVVPAEPAAYRCAYCLRPAQKNATRWKAGTAVLVLPSLADGGNDPLAPPKTPPLPGAQGLADGLCYSCYTHLTSRGGTGAGKVRSIASQDADRSGSTGMPMPVWVRRVREEEMKQHIGEFLLEE